MPGRKFVVGYKLTSTNRGCAIREASKEPLCGQEIFGNVCIVEVYNSKTCFKNPEFTGHAKDKG